MNAALKRVPPQHIGLLPYRFDVKPLQEELAAHPELWNEYKGRLMHPKSPHRHTDDIWVRFDKENIGKPTHRTMGPHISEWYPVTQIIPSAKRLALEMFEAVGGKELAGVLIIRIPPGREIYPHVDLGWHAMHHKKIAVQISGHPYQEFAFEDGSLSALPGESYWLDNSHPHWVLNPTDTDWTNMTVCYRN